MNNLKNYFIVVLLSSGMISCASVGGAWDAGTQIVTGTVDAVVGGAATITTAVAEQFQMKWIDKPMNYKRKTRTHQKRTNLLR